MAVAIIYKRTRDNVVVNQAPTMFPATVFRGLTFDGHQLVASDANLTYIDQPYVITKTTTISPVETYEDIVFDGEYFWGPVSGNAGIGQLDRSGARVNLIGSVFSQSPIAIAFDGHYLWGHYINILAEGTTILFQLDRSTNGISKQYTIPLLLNGLVFDGEFLITQTFDSGTRDLVYLDRATGAVVRRVTGETTGGDANGMTFDGEFIYTMLAV
jgi:hypothetical protein